MEDLDYAWRRGIGTDIPKANDRNWIHTDDNIKELLVTLGLAQGDLSTYPKPKKAEKKRDEEPKRPRGRPRVKPILVGPPRPQRPRGLPRNTSL